MHNKEESAPCNACLRAKKTLCSSSLLSHTSVPRGSPAPKVLLDLLTGLRLIEEESVRQNTLLGISQYIQFGESRLSCDTSAEPRCTSGITNTSSPLQPECGLPVTQRCRAGATSSRVCPLSAQGSVLSPAPSTHPRPAFAAFGVSSGIRRCPSES